MSNWRQEAAERELRDVLGYEEFGDVRFIRFKTATGPFGISTFLWYACAGKYWRQGITLMLGGRPEGPGTFGALDPEVFEILWGFLHPSRTVTPPSSGASAT